jgi:hypothetical protein
MYIIRQKSDNLVQYFFDAEPEFKQYLIKPLMALDIRPETHEIIQTDTEPVVRCGGLWKYNDNGDWIIANQSIYESVLLDAKAKKILAINALREQKIYSDIAYEFPDGPGVIQLRNNQDVRNIQSLVSGAQMQIIAGNPDAPMVFRDADDNARQLTATQIAQMGAYVLDRGQAVYTASWELKDQVNAASSFEELEAINIDEEMVITT